MKFQQNLQLFQALFQTLHEIRTVSSLSLCFILKLPREPCGKRTKSRRADTVARDLLETLVDKCVDGAELFEFESKNV